MAKDLVLKEGLADQIVAMKRQGLKLMGTADLSFPQKEGMDAANDLRLCAKRFHRLLVAYGELIDADITNINEKLTYLVIADQQP